MSPCPLSLPQQLTVMAAVSAETQLANLWKSNVQPILKTKYFLDLKRSNFQHNLWKLLLGGSEKPMFPKLIFNNNKFLGLKKSNVRFISNTFGWISTFHFCQLFSDRFWNSTQLKSKQKVNRFAGFVSTIIFTGFYIFGCCWTLFILIKLKLHQQQQQ